MELKRLLKGFRPICSNGGIVVLNKHNKLYLWDIIGKKKEFLLDIPQKFLVRCLSKIRIFERIIRSEPRAALCYQDILYVSYKSVLYKISLAQKKIVDSHFFQNSHNNPLPSDLVAIDGIGGFANQVVYGEYWMNDNGSSVGIYADNGNWKKVYEFPKNTVRHIHAIVPDKYRDCVWILTGDNDKESGFWKATNDFKQVEPVLIGKQLYRSCCAHVYPEGVLFATDSPDEQNYICMLKEDSNRYYIEKYCEINGSCIYSQQTEEGSYFSTVVEFDNNIYPNFLTWITYRRGAAIKSWYSDLIYVSPHGDIKQITNRFRKDIWPMRLCRYSAIEFCYVKELKKLLLYFVAVCCYDNSILLVNEKMSGIE